ncbi:MAG TPA: TIM barrel protein [Herpetosiphonaceae bacterium]|nr:TIM barrel protein [Herpetosiphonaceae bacterium]
MTVRIGLNGRFFPANWRPALDEIAFAASHGFRSMQFQGKEEGLRPEHLGAEFARLRSAMEAAGIVPVLEMGVIIDERGLTAGGSTPLDVLTANLPAITGLGCACAHWHLVPAAPMDAEANAALEEHIVPQLREGVGLAAGRFRFGLEHNEPDLRLFGQPAACARALEQAPGLHFVWDINHTIPEHLDDFAALIGRVSMLHVSDTALPEVNYHLPIGLGSVDFAAIGRRLRGWSGPAILEIGGLPKSGGYGRDTDAALIDSLERLNRDFND